MLRSQAEAEAAQAAEIGLSLPEERRRLAERQRNQNRVAQTDERTRLLGLSADQASSPLGQNLLRAAGLANGVATRQIRYGSLSRDDQEFLRSMDRGLTGDRTGGDMNRALRTFAGLDRSPERFSQVFNRASAVGQVKEDAATAQALATGRSASDTSKNALAEHTRLLTGIEQTMERMIKLNEHAADSRDTINARIAALERRLVNQDSRLRDSYNR